MDLAVTGTYKAIKDLSARDLPAFTLVTGENGSGKSQLLEALFIGITNCDPRNPFAYQRMGSHEFGASVSIDGESMQPYEVVYVPCAYPLPASLSTSVQSYEELIQNALQNIRQSEQLFGDVNADVSKLKPDDPVNAARELYGKNPKLIWRKLDPLQAMHFTFARYGMRLFDLLQEHEDCPGKIAELAGPKPWEILNDILQAAEFKYRVERPRLSVSRTSRLVFKTIDGTLQNIDPGDLSSGEQVFLRAVTWLFRGDVDNDQPRLLLLDEPDASLHPSLTRKFLDVVQHVLVRKYGIHVIMTTHSPSTVALSEEASVFELGGSPPVLQQIESRWSAVHRLTAGLVALGPDTKYVFVEDLDDQTFYNSVVKVLKGRVPPPIDPSPSIAFVPASLGRRSGGKSMVVHWLQFIEGSHFLGVVDQDAGNVPEGVLAPERYSIENYLLDPLAIYAYMVSKGKAQEVDEVAPLKRGEEASLMSRGEQELQRIVDSICGLVEPKLLSAGAISVEDQAKVPVKYETGQTLLQPTWVIRVRGKHLIDPICTAIGGLSKADLLVNVERARAIPSDLAELIVRIQREAGRRPKTAAGATSTEESD